MKQKEPPLINRDISWLSFNARVLQEAEDKRNPLLERLRFLGIFSNNLDEFYRVRVATARRMAKVSVKAKKEINIDPTVLLEKIQKIVEKQQKKFEKIYQSLKKEGEKNGIYFLTEKDLSAEQSEEIATYFKEKVRPVLVPIILDKKRELPTLKDKQIYLSIKLWDDKIIQPMYSLLKIPADTLGRFYVFKSGSKDKSDIILLDDIIRANLSELYHVFQYENIEAYTVKFTRDAELDIDDDISTGLLEQVAKSLETRKTNEPVRLVYDKDTPRDLLNFIKNKMGITKHDNVITGGKYHNFKDFISFPSLGRKDLNFEKLKPIPHPYLSNARSVMEQIDKRDIMLNYPYQSFHHIIDLLREAAISPDVNKICINLYRVAKDSRIINALVNAARNGKRVLVIVELRARFDEENNIYWSNVLQEADCEVIFGVRGLKVHSKLIYIEKKSPRYIKAYAHIGTGNFHEGTANIYGDTSLLTASDKITSEVSKVFEFFENNYKVKRYSHIFISPNSTRRKFSQLINYEIKNASKGEKAKIIIKLNNLVDEEMIKKLYEASQAGVKIKLIIRGICSLVPGVKGWSENIEVISIVGRLLEHSRILYFYHGGAEKYFISSADWMTRNLDWRVEVTTPIYDVRLKKQLSKLLQIQLTSDLKTRVMNAGQKNHYREVVAEKDPQLETYAYFKNKLDDSNNLLED